MSTATAQEPIDSLQDILERNLGPKEEIDLRGNEVDHYFFFDKLADANDLGTAWGLFPNSDEVRRRLHEIDATSSIVDGFGYRDPNEGPANSRRKR